MCNRDTGYALDSASNFRNTGRHLTHDEWESKQNEVYLRMNNRNSIGNLKNPHCNCGQQNDWDSNYCKKCGKEL